MKTRAKKTVKSRGLRFVNFSSNVNGAGFSCVNDCSLQNEYVVNDEQTHTVPYKLSLNVDDLINPSKTSRRLKKTKDPPRPQNSFVLFRRDFEVKYRLLHKDEKIVSKKISSLAAKSWNIQPPSVKSFFKQLEFKAFNKHKEMFPDYRYQPNKKKQTPNNVLGESCLDLMTLQSQAIEIPIQTSTLLDVPTAKVSDNITTDVVDASNTFIQEDGSNYTFIQEDDSNYTFIQEDGSNYTFIQEDDSNYTFIQADDSNYTFTQEDDTSYSFNNTFIQEDDSCYSFNNTFIQEVCFDYCFNNNTSPSCNTDFFVPASYNTALFEAGGINYYVSSVSSSNFTS
ncbi:40024_t:CDS:1 [Gigaspora margarita]|uniref:40024_t:CDS:1 n=1 Tax=Gigaspora margarita TaxID=4874 RepID=A0ABN7WD24_GIGMA|nr:40024_t:CDS:1 [Gigaspora margarita]